MDCKKFIEEQIEYIKGIVGGGKAINALSGGVDSSTLTVLGNKAIGDQLITIFVDSGLMRENEAQEVYNDFKALGIGVEVINAQDEFFGELKGIEGPEDKRNAVTDTFYRKVFSKAIEESGAKYLLHGTILTDIEETKAGIKRQHNIFEQIGIDPKERFGYEIIEPLKTLRKDGVREVAKELGLPEKRYNRIPFPGPGLATRVIGEVTPERIETVRKATSIVEEELQDTGAFQYLAVLMNDRATGMKDGKRDFGNIIAVRCVDSIDARTATPTKLSWDTLDLLDKRITTEVPGVIKVLYDITPKPPSTVEYI